MDAGKTGSKPPPPPPGAPPGQESRPAAGSQGKGLDPGTASGQEVAKATTIEEAEKALVRKCLAEAIPCHLQMEEIEQHRTSLGAECFRP
eukprot:11045584-Heterocapsa_arctica.AAC.1